MAVRSITLVDLQNERGYYTVDASFSDDGVFRLEGHDVGRAVGEFWGPGMSEYEWYRTVYADDLLALRALLGGGPNDDVLELVQRWCERNEPGHLDRLIRESSVTSQFWNRVGD